MPEIAKRLGISESTASRWLKRFNELGLAGVLDIPFSVTGNDNSQADLEITAYHEAGHAVIARLLGVPINWIALKYAKPQKKWVGEHNAYYDYDPAFIRDKPWDTLDLDSKLPTLHFQYPTFPEPYEEYKKVRDRCTIDYAGLITQRLFYKRMGQEENQMASEGCSDDMKRARERVEETFRGQNVQEELAYAEMRTGEILSNEMVWRILEDLAKYMIDAILQGKKEPEDHDTFLIYWFSRQDIYNSFVRLLTQRND